MEQNFDISVPGRGGRVSGLQGFLPRQSPTASRSSKKRISERIVEQIVDIPGGGLQDFRPVQSSSSSSHFPAGVLEAPDEPGQGFFRKKSALESESARQCQPIHAGSSAPCSSQAVGHDLG